MADSVDLIRNAVVSGLQVLVALHLEGSPGHETVAMTAEVWIDIVKSWHLKNTKEDSQRVQTAFRQLASIAIRWPAPNQLKQCLPKTIEQIPLYLEAKTAPMPESVKQCFEAILNNPVNAIKRGNFKPAYSIHIYRNPEESKKFYYQIVFNDNHSAPETPVDLFVLQADRWFSEQATPIGGPYERPKKSNQTAFEEVLND